MLAGAVLAGGKSRRFGRNKALENFRGQSLIARAIESLQGICRPVMVIANDLLPYCQVRAMLIQDFLPHQGPLGGIYSALLFSPHEWVLTKATDMPFLVPALVDLLLARRQGADVVVPVLRERYEPLLALYSWRCLPHIGEALEKEENKIVRVFEKIKVAEVSEEEWRKVDPEGVSFLNINTPKNLEELQWI
jgi:molybdenum cofactor guanylyltransferase